MREKLEKVQRAEAKPPRPKPPSQASRSPVATSPTLKLGTASAILANVLILGVWLYSYEIRQASRDFFYMSSQEDEYLEWATFWAFMLAAGVSLAAAFYQRRSGAKLPWFLAGVGLFCAVVAMEEISWGQRIFGYRPPAYFLENNFQLELNVHNVMSTDLRKWVLKAIILGYGVVLPLSALTASVKRLLERLRVVAPPLALVPSFLATFVYYHVYPWTFTGEWIELMLGLGFLFSALVAYLTLSGDGHAKWRRLPVQVWAIVASSVLVVGLGLANAAVSRTARRVVPENVEAARGELEALKRDFLSGEVETRCDRHRRLYTFMEKYGQDYLLKGEFAGLTARGLPEDRAKFFLDPWNSPYWIRDRCKSDKSRRVVFVYSFGPNRRRESEKYEIKGDDVGIMIYDGKPGRDIRSGGG